MKRGMDAAASRPPRRIRPSGSTASAPACRRGQSGRGFSRGVSEPRELPPALDAAPRLESDELPRLEVEELVDEPELEEPRSGAGGRYAGGGEYDPALAGGATRTLSMTRRTGGVSSRRPLVTGGRAMYGARVS